MKHNTGRRWMRQFKRQSKPLFWKLSRLRQRLQFRLRTQVFALARRRESWHESLGWISVFGRSLLPYGLLSVVLTVSLEMFERSARAALRPGVWISRIAVAPPDLTTASTLLVTFSQLGLVFLGLYFTAVSVVAGTAYAEAPAEVRITLGT